MPIKNLEKRREYHRDYQRDHRAGQPKTGVAVRIKGLTGLTTKEATETARGLLSILGGLIGQVLSSKTGDVYLKARCAGYLISIGLKAVEVADLEARVNKLENKIMGVNNEPRQ